MNFYQSFTKPILDFIGATIGLIIILPIFIIVLVLLLFLNKGKPFFLQPRPGKSEKIFNIIKFKTMNDKKDANGNLLSDFERLTTFGQFARKYSLDKIPQLLNVIKGDMSLIGPRPLLIKYLPLYNEAQKKRHNIKPGITGWAQVNGRNAISWKQKFDYDIHYVDNSSLLFDLKIFVITIFRVFAKKDVYTENNSIMPEFTGSNK